MRADEAWVELSAGRVPEVGDDEGATALVERYGPLVTVGRRLVVAQLGQSLDGFIASRTGDSNFVTGEEDREHLHRLRALVDAVIVGASTVVSDDCRLTVRSCGGAHPVRVVIDPSARIPAGSHLLQEGEAPTLWLVGTDARAAAPADHVEVVRLAADGFGPRALLDRLADRGLGRVLVEGGGRTVSHFVAAGVVDRLYVTSAPMLIGDGVPGLRFEGTDALSGARSGRVRRFVFGPDICTELDFRT